MNLKSGLFFTQTLFFAFGLFAQPKVKYAPAWFGPNANPVPDLTGAFIPEYTQLTILSDTYFGFGDFTTGTRVQLEVPLISENVSVKIWNTPFEYFQVTPETALYRNMKNTTGFASGDYYVQTRIRLLREKFVSDHVTGIDLILNSTLKTASGNGFENRRYFNTAGYYFDLEFGRSLLLRSSFITNMRLSADLGFMSWITSVHTQDDAALYGFKLALCGTNWQFIQTFSGYWGWMHTHPKYGSDYGDAPLVISSRFNFYTYSSIFFGQYQYGIQDFPYHQVRLGATFHLKKLTPDFSQYVD